MLIFKWRNCSSFYISSRFSAFLNFYGNMVLVSHLRGSVLPQLGPQTPRQWSHPAPDCVLSTLWLREPSDTGPWIKRAKGLEHGVGCPELVPHGCWGVTVWFLVQTPHFIVLSFIALQDCAFYKLNVCGDPASSKSVGTIFPTAFAHFVSLCCFLVPLATFQTLHLQKDCNLLKAQVTDSVF